MSHPHDPGRGDAGASLDARLARIEARLEELHGRVDKTNKGGGGIGCLGFFLFVVVIVKLNEILELLPK